jgi:hypothetical protein
MRLFYGFFIGAIFFSWLDFWQRLVIFVVLGMAFGVILIVFILDVLVSVWFFVCLWEFFFVPLLVFFILIVHLDLDLKAIEPTLIHVLNCSLRVFLLDEIDHSMAI